MNQGDQESSFLSLAAPHWSVLVGAFGQLAWGMTVVELRRLTEAGCFEGNPTVEELAQRVQRAMPERFGVLLSREEIAKRVAERRALLRSIQGKYADVMVSSDEFNKRKDGEIELEMRRR